MTFSLVSYLSILLVCCGYALAQGGAPERVGVAILLVAIALSNLMPKPTQWHYVQIEIGILLVDTVMLAAVTLLAIRAQRYWPVWWAGLKLCSIIVHIMMLAPILMPWSYSVASVALSFVAPPMLAIAAVRHRRRLARYGTDPAWSIPAHWSVGDGNFVTSPGKPS